MVLRHNAINCILSIFTDNSKAAQVNAQIREMQKLSLINSNLKHFSDGNSFLNVV